MIVFFVSQCEKKSRKKTATVLDNFAERIGSSTWKARITMEGLKAIKILLSKTASRHTAVACHRIQGKLGTELLWVVGNKRKFNSQGICPTNYTLNDSFGISDNDWYHLEMLKASTGLAALFHDWGKAWDEFQNLLNNGNACDHIRHEYVSLILFAAFVKGRQANLWLRDLMEPEKINESSIIKAAGEFKSGNTLFDSLVDPFSRMIGWLIASHHLQPRQNLPSNKASFKGSSYKILLAQINDLHGYHKNKDEKGTLSFSRGLLFNSSIWCKQISKWAKKALEQLDFWNTEVTEETLMKIVAHQARTALIIGDHQASSEHEVIAKKSKRKPVSLFQKVLLAKSGFDNENKILLEQHLIDVKAKAVEFCCFLPYIENSLGYVDAPRHMEARSPSKFAWQDKAVAVIKSSIANKTDEKFGFFALNMASTGTGKTFCNAKIMNAVQKGKIRYTLALGLRSLTLQTGDEYRHRIGLDETEMAVLVGSKAVKDLHKNEQNQIDATEDLDSWDLFSDWENVSTSFPLIDEKLSTKLNNSKVKQLLYAPVLVCTIDHIIGATEETSRGRHVIPWLRMLSSDLVIDEIDDFDGKDLFAIMRLIHLAGCLGKRIVLSSATIPPSLAKCAFDAYSSGWKLYAKTRNCKSEIVTAWIDETKGAGTGLIGNLNDFAVKHNDYVGSRLKKLQKLPVKRKAKINQVEPENFAANALLSAIELHRHNSSRFMNKNISFGVIRTANITPCVLLARYLLNAKLPENIDIRVLPYHSRFPRLVRHNIETMLDKVLKRRDDDIEKKLKIETIARHVRNTTCEHILFIVVATPVEEVGRDHDFDWAVLEPSSIRSLIQMSGRVMRHRSLINSIKNENVVLLNKNIKALNGDNVAYCRPGYELTTMSLASHDLFDLLDVEKIHKSVDSSLRILQPKKLDYKNNFVDLEHHHLDSLLNKGDASELNSPAGWNYGPWHLTALAQKKNPFRHGEKETSIWLLPLEDESNAKFHYKSDTTGEMIPFESWLTRIELSKNEKQRLWQPVSYLSQIEKIAESMGMSLEAAGRKFGEVNVPMVWIEDATKQCRFETNLGVYKTNDKLHKFFE